MPVAVLEPTAMVKGTSHGGVPLVAPKGVAGAVNVAWLAMDCDRKPGVRFAVESASLTAFWRSQPRLCVLWLASQVTACVFEPFGATLTLKLAIAVLLVSLELSAASIATA